MRRTKQGKPSETGASKQSTRLIHPEGDCLQVAHFESQLDFEDTLLPKAFFDPLGIPRLVVG
jgi:hypothetical protein